MNSKELISKAKSCKSKEELLEFAKNENFELSDDEAEKVMATIKSNGQLSDDELENVTGGTCYGDGWDGIDRAIVTHDNCCRLFEPGGKWDPPYAMICANCKYYSYRVNGKRISAFSAWCTHNDRREDHDVIND